MALFGALGAVLAACQAAAPAPVIEGITPTSGYTDRPVRLMIRGAGFLPTFDLDPDTHTRRGHVSRFSGRVGNTDVAVALHDFDWLDVSSLSAWMAPQLPPGTYPVQITDPRGQVAILDAALGFQALGPDVDRPTLVFESPLPSAPVAAGIPIKVAIAAADREPGQLSSLRWEAWARNQKFVSKQCSLGPLSRAGRCDADLVVPSELTPGELVTLTAVVEDAAGTPNRVEQTLPLQIQAAPTLTSITPSVGGTMGGLDVVVKGSGFFPGTRIYIDNMLLLPSGGMRVDNETISGRLPAHAAGRFTLLARTPIGDAVLPSAFQYAIAPQIDTIAPAVCDPKGGTRVRITGEGFTPTSHVFFGDTLASAVGLTDEQRTSDIEIVGTAPPGHGRTTVWVFDPQLGSTRLVDAVEWRAP